MKLTPEVDPGTFRRAVPELEARRAWLLDRRRTLGWSLACLLDRRRILLADGLGREVRWPPSRTSGFDERRAVSQAVEGGTTESQPGGESVAEIDLAPHRSESDFTACLKYVLRAEHPAEGLSAVDTKTDYIVNVRGFGYMPDVPTAS